jgi:glucokinase
MRYYLGLDLGGTNIKAGIVDDQGRILAKLSRPTGAEHGPAAVIDAMVDSGQCAAREAGLKLSAVSRVGIGSPGPLDFDLGMVKAAPNMPGWHDVPLRDRIAQGLGRPAVLENDANAAAFGEFWAGAGRDPNIRHLVMLTLGTGVGSGLIVNGKLIHGGGGLGGEGGHMIVMPGGRACGCGQRGCLETYTSASYTARRAVEAVQQGKPSTLTAAVNAGRTIDARDVFEAAANGDHLATDIVEETALYLGIACVNFCRLLDPQMIVFAAGMVAAGDALFGPVRRVFAEQTWKVAQDHVRIVPAQLGNDAGLVGAAAVAWDADRDR